MSGFGSDVTTIALQVLVVRSPQGSAADAGRPNSDIAAPSARNATRPAREALLQETHEGGRTRLATRARRGDVSVME